MSNGEWIEVSVPDTCTLKPFLYASVLAHLTRTKKLSKEKASQIAEAVVFKQLNPGLQYSAQFEKEILSVWT